MIKKIINKYIMFIKYLFSAGISYIVDIVTFSIFCFLFKNFLSISYILVSTIFARVVSSAINYLINKNKVFDKDKSQKSNKLDVLFNYYLLVIVQMFMSAIFVELAYRVIGKYLILIKFVVDCFIFVVNYFIQKKFIFNNKIIKFMTCFGDIKKFIKENKGICVVLVLSIILHILSMITLGFQYGLGSDDASYIASGIYFKNNFTLIMHEQISAQIMPGMTYIIAIFSYIFGEGSLLMLSLKILWMIFGTLSVLGLYKILRLYCNKIISIICSLFLLMVDFLWMDNIILTETPFMCAFIFLIYASLMLEKTKNNKYFYQILFYYMFAVLLKANISVYPVFLVLYLLLKKYNFKLLMKQLGISICVVLVFFIPWIIRNYLVFEEFIPLTYGSGNPKLLGTYQGYNYPLDNQEEYDAYINENASDEMKDYLNGVSVENEHKSTYYSLEKDGLIAEYRMKQWWNSDKKSMIKSYLCYKPYVLVRNSFYWKEIWGVSKNIIVDFRTFDIIITFFAVIAILLNRKHIKEMLFLGVNYVFQILVYSYTFAFDRYGQTLIFIRYVIIGIGIQIIWKWIKNFLKKEKVSNE